MKIYANLNKGDEIWLIAGNQIVSKTIQTKSVQTISSDSIGDDVPFVNSDVSFICSDGSILQGTSFCETKQELLSSLISDSDNFKIVSK